jgi:hypothetical protein
MRALAGDRRNRAAGERLTLGGDELARKRRESRAATPVRRVRDHDEGTVQGGIGLSSLYVLEVGMNCKFLMANQMRSL